jgi:hypothetical protein
VICLTTLAVNQATHVAMTVELLAGTSFMLIVDILEKAFIQVQIYNIDIYIFSFLMCLQNTFSKSRGGYFFVKSLFKIQVKPTPKSPGNLKDTLLFVTKALQIWSFAYGWWSCEEALTHLLICWKLSDEPFRDTCSSDSRLSVNSRHNRDM